MVKSPTLRARRKDSPFKKEDEIWIVKHALGRTPTQLRRLYETTFKIHPFYIPSANAFARVVKRFDRTGGVTGVHIGSNPFVSTPENVSRTEAYFTANPTASIPKASRDLDIAVTSLWFILRKKLHWKPYRYKKVHRLTPQNEEARLDFCRWVLQQPTGFEQKIIFSDEKYFVLHLALNRQNDRIWSPFDPDELSVCRYEADSKIMCWAALVDNCVLKLRWMDDVSHPKRVTADSYLAMVRDAVWPEVRARASHRRWWFMQDGAPVHVSNAVIDFLNQKFAGRVITRRGDHPWPSYSPDLNPLDTFFWGFANAEVWRRKPESLDELRVIVEEVAATLSGEIIRSVMANFRKRCEVCIEMGGSYFEYALERFE